MRILDRKETDVDATIIEEQEVETPSEPIAEELPAPARRQSGFEFELPIGYVDEDGRVHRSAVLRKMTGKDEAIMADRRNRNSAARMVSELLSSCLLSLGTIERPSVQIAGALYSADRYFLLLKLREITFGPELNATYACPTCRESVSLVEEIPELTVTRLGASELPEDIVVELEDGYVDRDGELYRTVVFRYPRGTDEEKVAVSSRENASRGKNALMTRCIVSLGDMPESRIQILGTSIFNDLTLGDRAIIDAALNESGPGVDMTRNITCLGCGRDYEVTLDLSNFLRRS
jgi:hypothetical protein